MTPPQALVQDSLREGFLTFDDITDSRFRLEERAHRNTLQIIRTPRQTLVHKTFSSGAEADREQAAIHAATQPNRRYEVPQVLKRLDRTLLTSTSPDLEPLGSTRRTQPTQATAERSATALASLHQAPVNDRNPAAPAPIQLDGVGPWILDSSPAARELIRELQQPSIRATIEGLNEALKVSEHVMSHGDIRPANVLIGPRGTICLIDWETAGRAPRWQDLGALIASIVELAIHAGEGPPPPTIVQAIIRRYAADSHTRVNLRLLIQCAGARLLQTAVEQALQELEPSPQTQAAQIAGRLFLTRPIEGAHHLGLIHGQ